MDLQAFFKTKKTFRDTLSTVVVPTIKKNTG